VQLSKNMYYAEKMKCFTNELPFQASHVKKENKNHFQTVNVITN